jgi:hypothetical protein
VILHKGTDRKTAQAASIYMSSFLHRAALNGVPGVFRVDQPTGNQNAKSWNATSYNILVLRQHCG